MTTTQTRRADPSELHVDIPNLRAPRLPTFGEATLCSVCGDELSDDEFPTCEECYVPERDGADYTYVSGWGWF